jgi:hypothetical protein
MLHLAMFQMLDNEMALFFFFSFSFLVKITQEMRTLSPKFDCSLIIKVVNLMIYMTSEESWTISKIISRVLDNFLPSPG